MIGFWIKLSAWALLRLSRTFIRYGSGYSASYVLHLRKELLDLLP